MHSTLLIGRGAFIACSRVPREVNKLGDATTVVAVYDGADGFTSLIKFCGRVCHFSRHRRLVGDEPRRTWLFCGKYGVEEEEKFTRHAGSQTAPRPRDPSTFSPLHESSSRESGTDPM